MKGFHPPSEMKNSTARFILPGNMELQYFIFISVAQSIHKGKKEFCLRAYFLR